MLNQAQRAMEQIEELARISEDADRLTRTYGSPAMRQANNLVATWMREAGMTVSEDAIGNIIGRYPGREPKGKTFILGSHLDTVRDAGKFDGPLGVVTAIACVDSLHKSGATLPFDIEVIGFADEEGVRFQSTYLGSKAVAGKLTQQDLKRFDSRGIFVADAIREFGGDPEKLDSARRDPSKLLGYAEVHIEQGPVLERKNEPVGVVSAISGQTRIKAHFTGQAGHAGTTPHALRRDALAAAAQFILGVESAMKRFPELVATVGQIEARPGASNVIPGHVSLTVDVRHAQDSTRAEACTFLQEVASQIGEKRGIIIDWETVHETQSVPCSRELTAKLTNAARKHLVSVSELPSGAGHDAAIMGEITPVAMLFVRCREGLSHHPDEAVLTEDVGVAIEVISDFLLSLANQKSAFSIAPHG